MTTMTGKIPDDIFDYFFVRGGTLPKCFGIEWATDFVMREQELLHELKEEKKEHDEFMQHTDFFQGFIDDETLSEEKAYEIRRSYLEDKFRETTRAYFHVLNHGGDTKTAEAKKNKAKFEYEVFTIPRFQREHGYSESEIEIAKKRNISEFFGVNERGFALCPFHKERTPSFHAEKNVYFCFGCGEKGNVINFIMKKSNLSFPQAMELLLS